MQLNEAQRQAAEHFDGPAVVIAGPGSGKTRVVAARAQRLLARGVDPEQLTLITFTNKAAGELRARLTTELRAMTFHGLAYAILREARRFRVLDRDGAEALVQRLIRQQGGKAASARALLGAISYIKNAQLPPEEARRRYAALEPHLSRIWQAYEDAKAEAGLLDFDDLLCGALAALADAQLAARWRARLHFAIVDEFQDTSAVQLQLLTQLCPGNTPNLMVVGDPDQAIYAWRGADPQLMARFAERYRAARYSLTLNYRSHARITALASAILGGARELKAVREEGPAPLRVEAHSRDAEAEFIAQAIAHHQQQGLPLSEIAVLMRGLWYSRPLEGALVRYQLPYAVVGGMPFWQRREVTVLMALLRAGAGDAEAARAALAALVPGVGDKRAQALLAQPEAARGLPEAEAVLAAIQLIERGARATGKALAAQLERAFQCCHTALGKYLLELAEGELERYQARLDNCWELRRLLAQQLEDDPTLDLVGLLNQLALSSAEPRDEGGERVRLMTVHAAKGLEFSAVFIVGLSEGSFPTRNALREGQLDEERRLLYVAASRAKVHLYLSATSPPSELWRRAPAEILPYDPQLGFQPPELAHILKVLGG